MNETQKWNFRWQSIVWDIRSFPGHLKTFQDDCLPGLTVKLREGSTMLQVRTGQEVEELLPIILHWFLIRYYMLGVVLVNMCIGLLKMVCEAYSLLVLTCDHGVYKLIREILKTPDTQCPMLHNTIYSCLINRLWNTV